MSVEPIAPILVGSEWRETPTRQAVTNPFTDGPVAEVCLARPQDVEEAVTLSLQAFANLARSSSHVRASALQHVALKLKEQKEDFARTICREAGKPITDARREVDRAIQTFSIASEEAKRIPGEVIPMDISRAWNTTSVSGNECRSGRSCVLRRSTSLESGRA